MTPIETPVAVSSAATTSAVDTDTPVAIDAATVTTTVTTTVEAAPVQSSAYRDRLNPWCVVRLSDQAPVTVARFRRRPDAEAHLQLLPTAKRNQFEIVFSQPTETIAE